MRPFMTLAATGLATLVLVKVLGLIALPVAGALIGLFLLMMKIGLVVLVACIAYWVFRRMTSASV